MHNVRISKAFTQYLRFIDELYHLIEDRPNLEDKDDKANIKAKYKRLVEEHRAEIKNILYN